MSRYHLKHMSRFFAVAIVAALLASACSDPQAPATPTPATPTVTETFTGTLIPLAGPNTHPFTVSQIGGIEVRLLNVTPGASVGLGIGTPSGASCLLLDNLGGAPIVASPDAQLRGTATVTGSFCVSVFDLGNLVEAVNYTITVLHS
jgi:hypothetical protein